MTPIEAAATIDNWDVVGKGVTSMATAIAFGVAMFLRQKFLEKRDGKSDDPPMKEWLHEFLKAMTEDRRESAIMFRNMAQEIREISAGQTRLLHHVEDSVRPTLERIENKTDALMQRRQV